MNVIYYPNLSFMRMAEYRKDNICTKLGIYNIPCGDSYSFIEKHFREDPNVLVIMDKIEPLNRLEGLKMISYESFINSDLTNPT